MKPSSQKAVPQATLGPKTLGQVKIRQAVKERPLYGSAILPFLVREYDHSLGGDVPVDVPWMEHILPQTPTVEWKNIFPDNQFDRWINTFANLIPLSAKMDQQIQNREYATKRKRYAEDAMYKSARKVAAEFDTWTPKALESRANELAEWAVKRWMT